MNSPLRLGGVSGRLRPPTSQRLSKSEKGQYGTVRLPGRPSPWPVDKLRPSSPMSTICSKNPRRNRRRWGPEGNFRQALRSRHVRPQRDRRPAHMQTAGILSPQFKNMDQALASASKLLCNEFIRSKTIVKRHRYANKVHNWSLTGVEHGSNNL